MRPCAEIDPGDRAGEAERIARSQRVLRTQRPTLAGRIAAATLRPRVDTGVAGTLAAARVEHAVRAQDEIADAVARKLLAPAIEQHGLPPALLEHRESPADHTAALEEGPAPPSTQRLTRAHRPVERVEHVEALPLREARVERQPEEPPIPEPEDPPPEVGEHDMLVGAEPGEDLDPAALLGDDDAPVAREGEPERFLEPAQHDFVAEALCRTRRRAAGREDQHRCGAGPRQRQREHDRAHPHHPPPPYGIGTSACGAFHAGGGLRGSITAS